MKLRSIFAALWLMVFFFAGCDKKEKDPEPVVQPAPEPGMTATIDGNPWKALMPVATTKNGFQLGGQSADEVSITLYHAGITQPGVYHVTAMMHAPIPNTASANTWANPNVEVTITKFDAAGKKVSGTFAGFTANANPGSTGTRTVTNGIFTDIPIQ